MGYAPAYHIEKEGFIGIEVLMDIVSQLSRMGVRSCRSRFYFSGSDDPHKVAWFSENARDTAGWKKRTNSAHLYDMTGNMGVGL